MWLPHAAIFAYYLPLSGGNSDTPYSGYFFVVVNLCVKKERNHRTYLQVCHSYNAGVCLDCAYA